jgi:hypothetical protein
VSVRSTRRIVWALLAVVAVVAGCRGRTPATLEQIEADQLALPAVYLTADGREAIVPANRGDVIVVPGSRQLAFRAYMCTNPDCPNRERGTGDRPFLFTWADPLWKVDEQGQLQFDVVPDRAAETLRRGGLPEPTCPGCLELRAKDGEPPETRQRYRNWVVYYELPESAARRKELDAEHRRRLQAEGRRR